MSRRRGPPMLFNGDGNFLRNDRRVERIMLGVAQHQLKRMLAGRQFDPRLGLTPSEMKMGFVGRNLLVGIKWLVDVNQQVMMPAVLKIVAGMGHAHVAQAEPAPEPAFDRRAVLWPYEIKHGILARGLAL